LGNGFVFHNIDKYAFRFWFSKFIFKKKKAPFRGRFALLPLDHTINATVGVPLGLTRLLATITLKGEQHLTLKAVSPVRVTATVARRPREVRVENITPLARIEVEGA
jgi:uncharacterized membrane protein YozB (DUF420 family)